MRLRISRTERKLWHELVCFRFIYGASAASWARMLNGALSYGALDIIHAGYWRLWRSTLAYPYGITSVSLSMHPADSAARVIVLTNTSTEWLL